MDCSPPGFCPWDFPGKNTGLGCHFLLHLTKVHIVKTMVFPVVTNGCENWTIKKAEHRRNDAFKLWCWRRLFRVPWTARRSNQSDLEEINPEYSLEELRLRLKLQYFGHWWEELTHWKRPWCWERLKVGGEEDGKGWLDSITDSMDVNVSKVQKAVKDWEARPAAVQEVTKSGTRLSDWTTATTALSSP